MLLGIWVMNAYVAYVTCVILTCIASWNLILSLCGWSGMWCTEVGVYESMIHGPLAMSKWFITNIAPLIYSIVGGGREPLLQLFARWEEQLNMNSQWYKPAYRGEWIQELDNHLSVRPDCDAFFYHVIVCSTYCPLCCLVSMHSC